MENSACGGVSDRWLEADGQLAAWLSEQGYACSTIAAYRRWVRQFGSWLDGQPAGRQLTAASAAEFGAAMRAAGCKDLSVRGAVRLLDYLERSGAVPQQRAGQVPPRDALAAAYRDYLISRRLAAGTIACRLRVAALLMDALDDRSVTADRVMVSARTVTGIVASWGTLARCRASPVRVFLRFLQMAGYIDEDLAAAIPRVRRSLPARQAPRLTADQARRLVMGVDTAGEGGKRDKAILLLLWRLGLRAGEITRLDLDDIGWRHGTLLVHRKGGRDEELPLLADVGQGLADYLAVRPRPAGSRAVMLTLATPRRRLSLFGVVSMVRRLSAAAGTMVGPHQFRHLLGAQLLEAGYGLRDVAQVLGHREGDLSTTIRYVTPPRQQMAGLVRPWLAAAGP